ncbi:MAG TPA: hypothetical protein VJT73_14680 [Polyangiaceae bacterium]|nr:hypothetical protein [Polyangiaceae bacterium]
MFTVVVQSEMSQIESVAHLTAHDALLPHEIVQSPWQVKSQSELPLQ